MSPIKKQKLQDVRSFLPSWTIDYGFIKHGDKSRCGLCSEVIVCRTSSIKRHFETNHREISEKNIAERRELISQRLKDVEKQSNLFSRFVKTPNNITEASFEISYLITKHSKPFSDGTFIKTLMLKAASSLFQDFNNKEKILQRIQELQMSRNTIKQRILKMSINISEQLQTDINSCDFFSICLDETTDINSSARLAIFARYSKGNEIREELLKLANIPERTRGADICEVVVNELKSPNLNVKKIVSITTDGAPNMTGPATGFVNLFQEHVGHPIIRFHCIIHQQMLCAKVGTSDLKEVSEKVNKIINFIVARDMHKRQFKKLLNDVDCGYDTLLMCNNVRWLSRAISLERFQQFAQRFLDFKRIENYLKIINYPDLFDMQDCDNNLHNWMRLDNLEMQIIDLQSNPIWVNKFVNMRKLVEDLESHRSQNVESECFMESKILEAWNSMPDTFYSVKKLAISLLTIFSSTYSCESLFSVLNHVHSKTRNRLTEEDSAACITLQSTMYQPDIKTLANNQNIIQTQYLILPLRGFDNPI
ncbi:zinc finger BED domain-containing protein 5-like [Condylostylus longicornis]|uniref:zinc finger BED domain-containing protein 5-like n=1 Tax=Condylostylus longicornis TaxID=2530218 RepID=UPI00244DF205|nr:zinc finger BED domain-containing protein 5-like [Condylostylus longicornis]